MKKKDKKIKSSSLYLILLRYLVLLALMFSLPAIYAIFTPLTLYPVLGLLKLFFTQVLLASDNILVINAKTFIQLIPACIAGSAYLLLLILFLTVPMDARKRVYAILFSFAALLVLNIIRIFILAILYHNQVFFFDFTHKLFWYGLSTIFVIGIWFLAVKLFSIKQIPVYSDIKKLTR